MVAGREISMPTGPQEPEKEIRRGAAGAVGALGVVVMVIMASGIGLAGTAAIGQELPFTEEGWSRGIQYTMPGYQATGAFGWGMALADLDGDDDLDLVLLGRSNGLPGIFENDGTGHFLNRSFGSGMFPLADGSGVIAFDFDGDRDLDLLFTQAPGSTRLHRNDGDFAFTDVTKQAGLGLWMDSQGANAGDYDGDGWLDVYVCNYSPDAAVSRNLLYRNLGDGTFEEVGGAEGVDSTYLGFQAVFATVDDTGWPGLYLSNDNRNAFGANQLWRNDAGAFVDVSEPSGAGVELNSMGLAAGDLNGDRLTDFYLTNTDVTFGAAPGNHLLLSQGDGTWTRSDAEWGVTVDETGWGTHLWDFDNDGRLDLYVNNSCVPNLLFRNVGTPPMQECAEAFGVQGTDGDSMVSVIGDVDGDGDLDMVQNDMGRNVALLVNHSGSSRRWGRLRIAGIHPNWHAVGATATVRADVFGTGDLVEQWGEIRVGGNGFKGQSELVLHFGLGEADVIDEIEVRWPAGGPARVVRNLPAGTAWTIHHPDLLGDGDEDGVVGDDDLALLLAWLEEDLLPGREMMDLDGDGAVGRSDLEPFFDRAGWRRTDLDRSGGVDAADLSEMLSRWGGGDPLADVNADGVVDGADLGRILIDWTQGGGG
jgi:hypothetical protein